MFVSAAAGMQEAFLRNENSDMSHSVTPTRMFSTALNAFSSPWHSSDGMSACRPNFKHSSFDSYDQKTVGLISNTREYSRALRTF